MPARAGKGRFVLQKQTRPLQRAGVMRHAAVQPRPPEILRGLR